MMNNKYCCPKCKGSLESSDKGYGCVTCARIYPIVAGIVDFRLYADSYISIKADRAKGLLLDAKAMELTFAELVQYYYSITPEVPADLAQYYLNHHIAGTTRGAGLLRRFNHYGLAAPQKGQIVADLGCGTGGFLATAAQQTDSELVGIDIAFRWLIVARKRLQELGATNVQLVCACADHLPFPQESFDHLVAENLIEHVSDQFALFAEIARVRKKHSNFLARTVNRFALGPEPHVGVWGVGYLPRPLMNGYVKMIKGIPYEHIHLQSSNELHRSIRRSQQHDLRVTAPFLTDDDYGHHPPQRQRLFRLYNSLAHGTPAIGSLVAAIGPYLDIASASVPTANARAQRKHVAQPVL